MAYYPTIVYQRTIPANELLPLKKGYEPSCLGSCICLKQETIQDENSYTNNYISVIYVFLYKY